MRRTLLCAVLAAMSAAPTARLNAQLTAEKVRDSIDRGKNYLLRSQRPDGSWNEIPQYPGGITSLCVLALIYSGVSPEHPAIEKSLTYLRRIRPDRVYAVSVQTMALVAASPKDDFWRIQEYARWLQNAQIKNGATAGMWDYGPTRGQGGDQSNTQFAMLALRDAAEVGVEIDPMVWRRAQAFWRRRGRGPQSGWGYRGGAPSGSMTVAGIASLIIAGAQLDDGKENIDRNGQIHRCGEYERDDRLQRAFDWLAANFSVITNPGRNGGLGNWWLYYLYGLERAGRLSGKRFIGQHDWYREGADILVNRTQDPLVGSWKGSPGFEAESPALSTSYALLFLSKGKSPVVINKLEFGDDWNNDHFDIPHLTDFLSLHWKRPVHERLTWQVVDLRAANVDDLLQAPIAYFNGHEAPRIAEVEIELLREYVSEGGTIVAEACCGREAFDRGFRELVEQMFPESESSLRRLESDHPIWRSEFLLDANASQPLWGLDFGCRTAVIYSPEDLSCFWEQWSARPDKESVELRPMIDKALSMGTNIVAYATGQEFADKLTRRERFAAVDVPEPASSRNLLPIAKLRHSGGSDAAPKALSNLMAAMHGLVPGIEVHPDPPDIAVLDPAMSDQAMLYMHGRSGFRFSSAEVQRLREYLQAGGVLFADATCGSEAFDRAFRGLCGQLFPEAALERIPADHALFKSAAAEGTWFDLRKVTRREPERAGPNEPLRTVQRAGEPIVEGIVYDGRHVVIYSPYDISCALEHSQDVKCRGYIHDDALRIAVNVVLYALHLE